MSHPSNDNQPTPGDILTLQRLFLVYLLKHGTGTIDDITPSSQRLKKFAVNQGNWRGIAVLMLMQMGLIRKTGERRTTRRPQRHATGNWVWEVADSGLAWAWLRTHPADDADPAT